jgi:hypothetical protein
VEKEVKCRFLCRTKNSNQEKKLTKRKRKENKQQKRSKLSAAIVTGRQETMLVFAPSFAHV